MKRVSLQSVVLFLTFSLSGFLAADDLESLKVRFQQERNLDVIERINTIQAIGEIDSEEAAQFLAEVIKDKSEKTSIAESAVRLVALHGHPVGIETAIEHGFKNLPERSYWVIRECWDRDLSPGESKYIAESGLLKIPALPVSAQSIVLDIATRVKDPEIGECAVKLLGNRKIPAHNQAYIVDLVRIHSMTTANKKLGRLFRVNDPKLQRSVLLALRQLEADDQSRTFHKALKSPHWTVRACAVDIFGDTRDPAVVKVLAPLLSDPFLEVQISAVQALRKIGGKDVVELFIKKLGKQKGRVLDDIIDALLWLTGKDLGPNPISWKTWWDLEGETADIKGITLEEFERIRAESANNTTGTYYGLRVISRFVTFIVDISGSMEEPYEIDTTKLPGGRIGRGTGVVGDNKKGSRKREKVTKIEVARRELLSVINGIPNGTQFNIIAFESTFALWRPGLVEMNEDIRYDAVEHVKGLAPRGMTNVHDTLMSALDDPEVNTIYFLSDGAPTMGKVLDPDGILAEVRARNAERKVKIHTIGFHLDPKASILMRRLASENYGSFVER
ncbi:MAG: HEAT repeat domain-containing protein [Planctomycetota bacterium]|nr:HEAT repeat domain-containing protein [Planctomycetota bacterium]